MIFNVLTAENQKTENVDDTFKVLLEAKLPKGFPEPGPLNKIIVKDYPECRIAKVQNGFFQNFSFMRLFMHIKGNDVSMTTPVVMKLEEKSLKRKNMAFIYGNTSIGSTGKKKGNIEVLDLPRRKYVSIGLRGYENEKIIKDTVSKLKSWLKENKDFIIDGDPRLLGYNSPMVSAEKRYFEIQLPIKKITEE